MIFGQCDCCGKDNRVLHRCVAGGIETHACSACRGDELADDIDDIENELARLEPQAESGEQHAHLCALYLALEEARRSQRGEAA